MTTTIHCRVIRQSSSGDHQSLSRSLLKKLVVVGMGLTLLSFGVAPAFAQTLSEKIVAMEKAREQEFATYFGESLAEVTQTPEDIALTLQKISAETGKKPAVLWVIPEKEFLHLVLVTPDLDPIVVDLHDVPEAVLRPVVSTFQRELQLSQTVNRREAAQQLYQWIIAPYAETLEAQGIDTLLFCLGNGVRGLPMAALFDGQEYLLEKYSLTNIPAFNLIDSDYKPLRPGNILAMGASEFADQSPLPAVPVELENIVWEMAVNRPATDRWQAETFLNQDFTVDRLQKELEQKRPTIVHLATHSSFRSGKPANSYIEFWNDKLALDKVNQINWQSPAVELLVLSACQTALGDDEAELGFAGLALKAGVKSAVASFWNVDDGATLVLMTEFYRQLGQTSTKAEALRQAQLKMLRGELTSELEQAGISRGAIALPPSLINLGQTNFSAPYYWASFTMLSSPW
ncbi:CHAT domain-containing protein [Synechocystis sp. PCC 7339]|uniref:CHAT domain-containing protein n=1 Tax=unclassified Synechocystis TaxID=2640012 RepID=UPI001BAF3EB8|nr:MULTISPECIES: CHAT domain-containing protein [unclassified Synechocystis]QUS60539.1 CHAT domain-containing protein [Synechocystis sp. PCC 7338]UAJ72009.1 CHAT domain-containing protein [Synechocystis sp. PCC 7339]